MPPSAAELAERAAIGDVLDAYAQLVDARDWVGLAALFTSDAVLDYTNVRGPRGTREEVLGWVAQVLDATAATSQHLLTNRRIRVAGDEADATVELLNPLVVPSGGGEPSLHLVGGRYEDRLVRTPHGWRIAERRHTTIWSAGPVPAALTAPAEP